MGTTLTGTTPQDTYDSLIKVTDNGPLSGTLKALSDGLGNDSTLSLSTTAASIAGTLAVTGNATFDTNTLFVDAAANEVGIGTITPNAVLNVIGEISQGDYSTATNSIFTQRSSGSILSITTTGTTAAQGTNISYSWANGAQGPLTFSRAAGEVMRLDASGNVGIGLTAPINLLHVSKSDTTNAFPSTAAINISNSNGAAFGRTMGLNFSIGDGTTAEFLAGVYSVYTSFGTSVAGSLAFITNNGSGSFAERARITSDGYMRMASGTGGIQFNGDTAAANALDDYEEGTFTATLVPSTSGSITLEPTIQTGVYTKIGRQVTVRGYIAVQSVSVPVGAEVYLRGLPFTINGSGGASVTFFDAPSYAGSNLVAVVLNGTTQINIVQSAALVSNGEEYYFTATYFV